MRRGSGFGRSHWTRLSSEAAPAVLRTEPGGARMARIRTSWFGEGGGVTWPSDFSPLFAYNARSCAATATATAAQIGVELESQTGLT